MDTSLLIDVLEDDPEFGEASAATLERLAEDGLAICPVTYAELAPAFEGSRALQEEFLAGVGVDFTEDWTAGTPSPPSRRGTPTSGGGAAAKVRGGRSQTS
jgi:hypothetical protein